jgi:hypothetical protein
MPFVIERMPDKDLTVIAATGIIEAGEAFDAVKAFYDGTPTKNVIWDFRGVAMTYVSEDEISRLFDYSMKHLLKRQYGKTALVAPGDHDFDMAKKTSTFSELTDTPWDMQAFRTIEEAAEWIGVKLPTP